MTAGLTRLTLAFFRSARTNLRTSIRMKGAELILCVFLLPVVFTAVCNFPHQNADGYLAVNDNRFKLLPNVQLLHHKICTLSTVDRLNDCVELCRLQMDCESFYYSMANKTCQLNSGTAKTFPADIGKSNFESGYFYESSTRENKVRFQRQGKTST